MERRGKNVPSRAAGANAREQVGAGVSGNRKPGVRGQQELKLGAAPGQGAPRRRGPQVIVAVFPGTFLSASLCSFLMCLVIQLVHPKRKPAALFALYCVFRFAWNLCVPLVVWPFTCCRRRES